MIKELHPLLRDVLARLSKEDQILLKILGEIFEEGGEDEPFTSFVHMMGLTSMDRPEIRRRVRRLARLGLAEFGRGLCTMDGEFRGAGYRITETGFTIYQAIKPDPVPPAAVPWDIKWYVCRADSSDVAHAKANGKPTPLVVGEELWRVPREIGPFSPNHDHWSGWNLGDVSAKDVATAAFAPVMRELLEQIDNPTFDCTPRQYFIAVQERARKILADMKNTETAKP